MSKLDQILARNGSKIRESASHRGKPAAMPGLGGPVVTTPADDRDAGLTRSKDHMVVPLAKITADPHQPRTEFDEDALARLADDIRLGGVRQAISVRWDVALGKYVVVFGERRFRAATMAGLPAIPCTILAEDITPGELLSIQLKENLLREDLKPVEQAKAFAEMIEHHGWSGNRLAKELGASQTAIVQALALLKLPESVQEAVDEGKIGAIAGYVIASKVEDPAAQEAIAERVVAEKMDRAETNRVVEETIQSRPEIARKPSKGKGSTVTATGRKSEAKIPTESAAHEGQGRAGPSIDAPVPSVSIADDHPPTIVTHETDDYIVTVRWKHASGPALTTIAGDLVRFAKRRADAEKEQAKARGRATGQGGEPETDAGADAA